MVWLTISVVTTFMFVESWLGHRSIEEKSSAEALSFARLVEEHATATIERANLTLLVASDAMTLADFRGAKTLPEARRKLIEAQLKVFQQRAFGVVSMSITDADGYVFANSLDVAPGRSLGDRAYFLRLKAAPTAKPVISEAIYGRVSNRWGVQVARRVDFPDGRFAGMIVANLGLSENFERFYQSINLGKDSVITLLDGESRLMVRYPILQEAIGRPVAGLAIGRLVAQGQSEAVLWSVSPLDGMPRLVAIRKIPDFPIYAIVGLSQHEIYRNWKGDVAISLSLIALLLLAGGLITREIRVRQRVEQALRMASLTAEKSTRTKTKFLAAASHDLRQPLQAISLFLSALNRTPLDETQRQIVGQLGNALRSQGDMLNTLLDISRLDAGVVEPSLQRLQVRDVMGQIDAEFAALFIERKLRFKIFLPFDDMYVRSDPQLLLSMLRNVVGNALKYTDRGGVLVSARRRGDRILFQVWDTGVGISAEHLTHVFEEYFQIGNPERDRSKGLGLGLSIVNRLARLTGSEIACDSRLRRGTVFSISVPADQAAAGELEAGREIDERVPGNAEFNADGWAGKRIVIIEDDPMVGSALALALSGLGMAPHVFADGEAAIEHSIAEPGDFHISDYRLPGLRNGLQVLREIEHRIGRPIHGVLLTGDTSPERIEATRKSPWPVLYKPVELAVLLAEMARIPAPATGSR